MVKEHKELKIVQLTWDDLRRGKRMVKEHTIILMEVSILGNTRMTNQMGQGTMSYPDGEKCEGEWINGGFRNGKCYNKNGTIQYNFVNGEGIKQYPPL